MAAIHGDLKFLVPLIHDLHYEAALTAKGRKKERERKKRNLSPLNDGRSSTRALVAAELIVPGRVPIPESIVTRMKRPTRRLPSSPFETLSRHPCRVEQSMRSLRLQQEANRCKVSWKHTLN